MPTEPGSSRSGATEGYVDKVDIVLDGERCGKGPTGVSISERRHVASQDIEHDPVMAPWQENALRHGCRSSASFPPIVRDAAVGAFTMYADESGFFDDQQIELLDELAADLSFAMELAEEEVRRRQTEEELERRGGRLEEVVEMRDPLTAGHQRRVSELALRIAQEMGISAQQIEEIRIAALIDDVGRVSVPSELLSKPGTLSPVELSLIKAHAEAGHTIIAAAHMEGPTAEIVYQHHERCDGSGYPRGLLAEQLLLSAKALMVADVVEAMMSRRPYRPGLGIEAALAEIERGVGSVYDAEVRHACLTVFRERGFAFSEA